jgi:hypothetical protein
LDLFATTTEEIMINQENDIVKTVIASPQTYYDTSEFTSLHVRSIFPHPSRIGIPEWIKIAQAKPETRTDASLLFLASLLRQTENPLLANLSFLSLIEMARCVLF